MEYMETTNEESFIDTVSGIKRFLISLPNIFIYLSDLQWLHSD